MCSSPARHEITMSVCETVRRGENRVRSPWVRWEICRYQDNMPLNTYCSREEKQASTITTAAYFVSQSLYRIHHRFTNTSYAMCTSFCVCVFQHSEPEPWVILTRSVALLCWHQIMSLLLRPGAANLGVSPSVSERGFAIAWMGRWMALCLRASCLKCSHGGSDTHTKTHTRTVVTSTHLLDTFVRVEARLKHYVCVTYRLSAAFTDTHTRTHRCTDTRPGETDNEWLKRGERCSSPHIVIIIYIVLAFHSWLNVKKKKVHI